jgi:hypothetical protein
MFYSPPTSAAVRVSCVLADCASPREDFPRHGSATLALLSFAMLIVSLDQYIVVVALPEIGRDLISAMEPTTQDASAARAGRAR